MEEIVFNSIEELAEYLKQMPDGERVTITVETDYGSEEEITE